MVEKHHDFFCEHPVSKETKKHPGNVLKKSALSANNRNKKRSPSFIKVQTTSRLLLCVTMGYKKYAKFLALIQALRFQKRLSQQSISYLNHDWWQIYRIT